MVSPKIGLLPLYLALYDEALPEMRGRIEEFYATIAGALRERGLEVVTTPICRLEGEFRAAVESFERAGVDALVTLHLAYSPSLESVGALAMTRLPIIVLDTTPANAFGPGQDPAEILYNHGIHGVQDMCNLLIRRDKDFHVEAGHWERSDVLDRVAGWARAARLAKAMREARVGRLGAAFKGMGDFAVPEDILFSTLGVATVPALPKMLASLLPKDDDEQVQAEMAADRAAFDAAGLDEETHRRTARAGLAIRRWVERERLTAFSINFQAVDLASGLPSMPFLEASKAMARGIGYAGEGDVLTAALVGALASVFPATTFTEMFCPDWEGESIFLSHMGEMNLALAAGKPLLRQKPFPWTDAADLAVAVGCLRPGPAVLVNLAPGRDNTYSLVIAPCEMLPAAGDEKLADTVRGWLRPALPLADFLAAYSRAGGTHHSALVYDASPDDFARFGQLMGWTVVLLEG
ncbi:MAG: L-arabinose isomerase family protein [Armatimonadota bacterium]